MKLTKKSKDLLLFIKKNGFSNKENMSNKTKNILSNLFKELLTANHFLKNIKYNYKIKNIQNKTQISKPTNFNADSFPILVRNYIDKNIMSEICYTFSIYERDIKVYFFTEQELSNINMQIYNNYIRFISMWLYMLNLYSSKKCVKSLTIYFYLTSLEKHLPENNIHILNEINANTAFTTTCPINSEIVVYRKEEWFKVFIHETFHNFGLDFSSMNNNELNKCILNIFKVKSKVNVFESYCEFWAEIINVIFCSYSLCDNNLDTFLKYFATYINYEEQYSLLQMVKILDYMGLKYKDLYSPTNHSALLRENLYKENTNILSYYIIKCILLNNYQKFFAWCNSNNANILDFRKTVENQKSFCKFIEHYYKSNLILKVKYYENILNNLKKSKKYYILSNMRMTVCELG
jgi:hypothetical protein